QLVEIALAAVVDLVCPELDVVPELYRHAGDARFGPRRVSDRARQCEVDQQAALIAQCDTLRAAGFADDAQIGAIAIARMVRALAGSDFFFNRADDDQPPAFGQVCLRAR